MVDFPILFTGKDVHYIPKTSAELTAARDRFHRTVTGVAKYKADQRKAEESAFFKMADVDPAQLMSAQIAKEQELLLENYNDKWTGIYSEQGGMLTSAQKSEMFRNRKSMEAKQAQWLASQERFERDLEMIKRDSMRATQQFDHDHWAKQASIFYSTGDYKDGLQFAPTDLYAFYNKKRKSWEGPHSSLGSVTEEIDGKSYTSQVGFTGSDQDARDEIYQDLFYDNTGTNLMGAIKAFTAQPEDVKKKYLIDGPVDTPEEKNAIIRWAQDEFTPILRQEKTIERTKPAQKSGGGTKKPTPHELIEGVIYDRIGNEIMRQSDGVSGMVISSGQGYEFTDKNRTINVDAEKLFGAGGKSFADTFGSAPKTKVKVRPEVMTGGEVEFLLAAPVKVERKVAESELTRDIIRKAKVKDGEYYITETIPTGTPVGAHIKDVETDLANMLGGNSLKNAIEGLDPYAKYKE